MEITWLPMSACPDSERVFLLLRDGEKRNGELTVGMIVRIDEGPIECYWTWGGPNSGSDIDEAPVAWAPLPSNWRDALAADAAKEE